MDHIIPLRGDRHELFDDWYRMHVLLNHRLGPRLNEEGKTLWSFSLDPRAGETPVVVLRTTTEAGDLAARAFAVHSEDTFVPEAGETVAFAITCSGRVGRPGWQQAAKEVVALKSGGVHLNASKCLGNLEAQADRITRLLARSGLVEVEIDEIIDQRFFIRKSSNYKRTGIGIVGAMAIGTAKVEDAAAVEHAIATGLGRDKAFGFGTLILTSSERKDAA